MKFKNKILHGVILLFGLLAAVVAPTFAQEATESAAQTGQRIAAVQDDQLVIIEGFTTANPTITPVMTVNFGQISPVWSSDGQWLAFKNYESGDLSSASDEIIYVTDGVSEPIPLDSGLLVSGMPISWSPDDSQIIYATYDGPIESRNLNEDGTTVALLYGIAPQADAEPMMLGTFAIGEGCGGGSPYPADWRYWQETEFGGTRAILQLTPFGLVHSAVCAGNVTTITNLETGETVKLGRENLQHAVISPDGTRLAGTEDGQIVIYDLAAGAVEFVRAVADPDQLAWGVDGSLYYSTRTETGNLFSNLATEGQTLVTQFTGLDAIPDYAVSIYRAGASAPLFSGDYYAVGRMALLPDNSGMVFSVVDNMDAWVNGIADGTFDFSGEEDFEEQENSILTSLVYLPFDGEPVIHRNFGQFVLNNGA